MTAPAARRDVNLWIENAFATLGMENYPYAIGDYPAYPMKAACQDAIDADVSSDVRNATASQMSYCVTFWSIVRWNAWLLPLV